MAEPVISPSRLRLNLMCGEDIREGWHNLDLRHDIAGVTWCDVRALDYPDASVAEIMCLDGLEHWWRDVVPPLLTEWNRVLVPGGLLTVRVPNMEVLAKQIIRGIDVEATIRNIMGGHRWGPDGAYDTHHWNYTPATLAAALGAAGFRVQSNDRRANMTVVAQKAE